MKDKLLKKIIDTSENDLFCGISTKTILGITKYFIHFDTSWGESFTHNIEITKEEYDYLKELKDA